MQVICLLLILPCRDCVHQTSVLNHRCDRCISYYRLTLINIQRIILDSPANSAGARRAGERTRGTFRYTDFPGLLIKPLLHLSAVNTSPNNLHDPASNFNFLAAKEVLLLRVWRAVRKRRHERSYLYKPKWRQSRPGPRR